MDTTIDITSNINANIETKKKIDSTIMCQNLIKNGKCELGKSCEFSHSNSIYHESTQTYWNNAFVMEVETTEEIFEEKESEKEIINSSMPSGTTSSSSSLSTINHNDIDNLSFSGIINTTSVSTVTTTTLPSTSSILTLYTAGTTSSDSTLELLDKEGKQLGVDIDILQNAQKIQKELTRRCQTLGIAQFESCVFLEIFILN